MKKIITLMLLIGEFVCTANSKTLYIENADPTNWLTLDVYAWNKSDNTQNNVWGNTHTAATTVERFGITWYTFELADNYNAAIIRGNSSNWDSRKTGDIYNINEDTYITVSGFSATKVNWLYPRFLNNINDSDWDGENNAYNATIEDALTYSKTFNKSELTGKTHIYFRFRAGHDNYYPQLYPQVEDNQNQPLGIPESTTTYWQDGYEDGQDYAKDDNNNRSWKITIPTSYNYDIIKLTAAYRKIDGVWKWKISADAYISKEITSVGYATFGSNADVDFSNFIPVTENTSFTAKTCKVSADGIITYSNSPIDKLQAGQGALLHGDAGTYLIPVTTSVTTSNNDFIAIDSKVELAQKDGSNIRYILTNKKSDNTTGALGFYMVNASGSWCGDNTAYLEVEDSSTPARGFFPIWDESNSIEDLEIESSNNSNLPVFDLQGHRVNNPQKGLYIVNGKKVIK